MKIPQAVYQTPQAAGSEARAWAGFVSCRDSAVAARVPGTAGAPEERALALLSLRLPATLVAAVKGVTARGHLPHQTLMRAWLAERLEQESRRNRSS